MTEHTQERLTVEASVIRSCIYEAGRRDGPMWAKLYRNWSKQLKRIEQTVKQETFK